MTFRMIKPAARVGRKATKEFGCGKNDEIRRGKTKSAREDAEDKVDIFQSVPANELAEAFDLPFRLKIDDDARVAFLPFAEPLDELVAFRFGEKKVPHREFANVTILKRAAEILRPLFDPAFADLDPRGRSLLRFQIDRQIVFADVVANKTALIVGAAEQDVDFTEVADRCLRVDVEFAERFDIVAEEFHTHRQRRLPGIEIDNAAADGELSARRDLRDALITRAAQFIEQLLHRRACAAP